MNVQLQILTLGELTDVSSETLDFAAASDLIIELRIDNLRAGLIGFVPQSTEKAYLWMEKGPPAITHPTIFARYARRITQCYASKYHLIWGHSNPESRRWLEFLGAEIEALPGSNIVRFQIHG